MEVVKDIAEDVETGDIIETVEGATIQHGNFNDRVYLMKLPKVASPKKVIGAIEEIAKENTYGKIFVKAPQTSYVPFREEGYEIEAAVPGFYQGEEQALFMVKYLDDDRKEVEKPELLQEIIEVSRDKPTIEAQGIPPKHILRELDSSDAEEMAQVYDQVFPTYPFPINDPGYLKEVMADFVRSFGIFAPDGALISLAACEIDKKGQNVEMTDFATLPEHRGQGLAHEILMEMETAMRGNGIRTAYTIARAKSFGMNITFSKAGYGFGGTLKNNTNISGSIESMNVWFKNLA